MTESWRLGATESAALIRSGELASSELIDSVLGRIDDQNPALNAIISRRDGEARREAAAADQAIADGADVGPLHGVPVTIKVNIDVAGEATTNGIPAFADLIAVENSPLVDRLTEAGAIIIGRTNTPEFSMRGTTENPLHGRTHNPWGDPISAGGSSGGAGSACAAGMGPLHHGNDIGGSLRFPSFQNGVMTLKPSSSRVPVFNSTSPAERGPLSQQISVQGIIARHAADLRVATEVMITPDPRDPLSPPVPWNGPDLGMARVAVCRKSGDRTIHPGIDALIDQAAAQLSDAGYEVIEAETPPIIDAAAGWFSALTTELKSLFDQPLRALGSDLIVEIFEWYYDLSELLDLDGYIRASADATRLKRDWSGFLTNYPLVLCPFLLDPAYDHDVDTTPNGLTQMFSSAIWSTGINYLGLPAGVIGTGMVEGRPAGVQIVGQRWREDLICDALSAIENRNGILATQLWD